MHLTLQEQTDLIKMLKGMIPVISGGIITGITTLITTWMINKHKERNNKKIEKKIMRNIWNSKISILIDPLLEIQKANYELECYNILVNISQYHGYDTKEENKLLLDLLNEEDYIFFASQTINNTPSLNTVYIYYHKEQIKVQAIYENLINKSINELKELKNDLRSQYHNDFISTLLSLQKMINVLEENIMEYAYDDNFIDRNIYDAWRKLYKDDKQKIYSCSEIKPTRDNYIKCSNSKFKNKLLKQIEKDINKNTLLNEKKWNKYVKVNIKKRDWNRYLKVNIK